MGSYQQKNRRIKMEKSKIIGAVMMLPLPVLIISLVLKTDFWVYLVLVALASFAFSYGFKLFTGSTAEDIRKEVIEDIEDIKEEVEEELKKRK